MCALQALCILKLTLILHNSVLYVYVYAHDYAHVYVYVYKYAQVFVHLHAYVLCMFMCICLCIGMYVYIYMYICIVVHVDVDVDVDVYVHIYMDLDISAFGAAFVFYVRVVLCTVDSVAKAAFLKRNGFNHSRENLNLNAPKRTAFGFRHTYPLHQAAKEKDWHMVRLLPLACVRKTC